MADPLVVYSDVELFLAAWYRWWLGDRPEAFTDDIEVDTKEPAGGQFPKRLLVIRDDSGPITSFAGAERAIGLSVLAGTRQDPQDAIDLANLVLAARVLIPQAGFAITLDGVEWRNPVSAVLDANGPYPVEEAQDRARYYSTMTLAVHPEPL